MPRAHRGPSPRSRAAALVVCAAALALAACDGAMSPNEADVHAPATLPSAPAPTLSPPDAERGPTSTPDAGAAFVGGDNATFQGVTIVWPEGLANGAGVKAEPATASSPDAAPPATTFVLDGYADAEAQFPATVKVYALGQGGPDLADAVASLKSILAEQPAEPKVPMPATPASRVFMTHIHYVDGAGYRGVRFVTQLAQDIQPINNASLVYAFEGLTDDGTRWIQGRLPIDARSDAVLPNANIDDYAGFAQRFDSYLVATTAAVNALAPSDFTPTLDALDALVGGLLLR